MAILRLEVDATARCKELPRNRRMALIGCEVERRATRPELIRSVLPAPTSCEASLLCLDTVKPGDRRCIALQGAAL
jgi:hypothetical protein